MKDFKCYDCGQLFKAKGQKKEFNDAIYGPCSKFVALCPKCHEEAGEYAVKAGKGRPSSGGAPCGKYDSCSGCGG